MINYSSICTVFHYEVKIIRRSWLFKLFLFLVIILIGYYQLIIQGNVNSRLETWGMVAFPGSMPLINVYLFNFLQSIIIIFIGNDFFSREKNIDTLEVIRSKPIGGLEYYWGKILGIIWIITSVNLISLGVTALVNTFLSVSPFNPILYFFYFLTFTLPTTLFILGVTTLIYRLTRNRIVSLLSILILLYCCFRYLTPLEIVDPFARTLPNAFSDIIGHVNLSGYLAQRIFFLCLGIGLLFYSANIIKHLPDKKEKKSIAPITGTIFIVLAIGINYTNYHHLQEEKKKRAIYRQTAITYPPSYQVYVVNHTIEYSQKGKRLFLKSDITIENRDTSELEKINFYLNPGLSLTRVNDSHKNILFQREQQVIIVNKKLQPGESFSFQMEYEGKIENAICYLDIPDQLYYTPNHESMAFSPGRANAFTEKDFTLLIPECMWYPVTYPPVDLRAPYETRTNFTHYTLKVISPSDNLVVSQGISSRAGDTIQFRNTNPLSGITLCQGKLEEKTIHLDSLTIIFLSIKGHCPLPKSFSPDDQKTLKRAYAKLLEKHNLRPYDGKRLTLIETPVSFISYYRDWKNSSELVQPEMILLPEKGYAFRNGYKLNAESYASILDMDTESAKIEVLFRFMSDNFITPITTYYDPWILPQMVFFSRANKQNPTLNYVAAKLFDHTTITSSSFPAFNFTLKKVIRKKTDSYGKFINQTSMPTQEKTMAQLYLNQGNSFQDALQDSTISNDIRDEIVTLKGENLFAYLMASSSEQKMMPLMDTLLWKYQGELPFDRFIQELENTLGIPITRFIHNWYQSRALPFFQVKDVERARWTDNPKKKFVRLKIENSGDADGIIRIEQDKALYNYYLIPRGNTYEISLPEEYYSLIINTGLARNIPETFNYTVYDIPLVSTTDTFSGIRKTTPFPKDSIDEIIVDNESPYFQLIQPETRKIIQFFQRKNASDSKQFSLYAANNWTKIMLPECYGDTIRSAYYKMTGEGKYKASWQAPIAEAGLYEVFFYNIKYQNSVSLTLTLNSASNATYTLHYTIQHAKGENEITVIPSEASSGWVSLGKFYFKPGKAQVVLSDIGKKASEWEDNLHIEMRSLFNWKNINVSLDENQIIFADAVKWVRTD